MGQRESKSNEFEQWWTLFDEYEQGFLEHFKHINNKEQFEKYISGVLPQSIVHRFWREMTKKPNLPPVRYKAHYHFENVVITLGWLLKANVTKRASVVRHLAMDHPHHLISYEELKKFVEDIIQAFITGNKTHPHFMSWFCTSYPSSIKKFSHILMAKLKETGGESSHEGFNDESLQHWLHSSSLFNRILDSSFLRAFGILPRPEDQRSDSHDSLFPWCRGIDWSKTGSLLDIPLILFLNSYLPVELRNEWLLAYSSLLHGESFSTFVRSIVNKGPLLIIVKDKHDYIFGGFVSENLQVSPQFKGSHRCFLFSLAPTMGVYSATAYNENYVYINFGQQTLPNGFGMGGQYDYFGLWIDSSFDRGHSKAEPKCLTYDSPQLSHHPDFRIDGLEVWRLGPQAAKREEEPKESVLDKHVEAKAMLSLASKQFHSEGLRESD